METQISVIEKPFVRAREKFEQLCQKLESTSVLTMTPSEVESCLQIEGALLLRHLFQDHLDLRTLREKKVKVAICSDGIQRLVAQEAARCSYDETLATVERYTAGKIAKRQAEELMQKAACDFESFYAQEVFEQTMSESLLALSLDAKGIVMRLEDLREQTRKAAQKNQHKLEKRLCKGEKKHRKRMATAATVYSIATHPRTPSIVSKEMYPHNEKPPRPKPVGKRVWASVEKEVETIVKEMFSFTTRPSQRKAMGGFGGW